MKICIYSDLHPRSKYVSQSMYEGANAVGLDVEITHDRHFEPRGDILVAYGWKNEDMFSAYEKAGLHYLYIDLGYWGRRHFESKYGGYYKVVLNGRHPTRYFRRRARSFDRLDGNTPEVKPWRVAGNNIIVAGHSDKAALSIGRRFGEWEEDTISKIKKVSNLPIVYRPKPCHGVVRPIQDTTFSHRFESIYHIFDNAYVLVAYHSNVAIEALAYGVPVIVEDGPCATMGSCLDKIDNLYRPQDREQFVADLSYCQWRRSEMSNGGVYQQFMDDGLI